MRRSEPASGAGAWTTESRCTRPPRKPTGRLGTVRIEQLLQRFVIAFALCAGLGSAARAIAVQAGWALVGPTGFIGEFCDALGIGDARASARAALVCGLILLVSALFGDRARPLPRMVLIALGLLLVMLPVALA